MVFLMQEIYSLLSSSDLEFNFLGYTTIAPTTTTQKTVTTTAAAPAVQQPPQTTPAASDPAQTSTATEPSAHAHKRTCGRCRAVT